jgi:hypothetical protein
MILIENNSPLDKDSHTAFNRPSIQRPRNARASQIFAARIKWKSYAQLLRFKFRSLFEGRGSLSERDAIDAGFTVPRLPA